MGEWVQKYHKNTDYPNLKTELHFNSIKSEVSEGRWVPMESITCIISRVIDIKKDDLLLYDGSYFTVDDVSPIFRNNNRLKLKKVQTPDKGKIVDEK